MNFLDESIPLTQAKFTRKEKQIHFSHAKHMPLVGKKCDVCHADFTKIDFSSESPMTLPTMEVCTTRVSDQASTASLISNQKTTPAPPECLACHTTLAGLKPPSHREADFRTSHKEIIRLGSQKENCASCHSDSYCQECHSGSGVSSGSVASRFYAPDQPRVESMDNAHPMVVQKVHDLNYRFTHGIDADWKFVQCQSCHEERTFCAQCHNSSQRGCAFPANTAVTCKSKFCQWRGRWITRPIGASRYRTMRRLSRPKRSRTCMREMPY